MTDADAAGDGPRILAGSPTEEETAAIAAVFAELLATRAAVPERLRPAARPSGWTRTARQVRSAAAAPPRWGEA